MSTDLTFFTNEPGRSVLERFRSLLGDNTRFFDCLVGYFYLSGFHKIYPRLTNTEKVRILVGLKTDQSVYGLLQEANVQRSFLFSHAETKETASAELLMELERTEDSESTEEGIRKFVEWCVNGKLEIKAYPS